jgi:hypothetical protein
LGVLFAAVYWLVLRWLWDKTNPIYGEANWGHAICVPIVGLYYLYINRDELLEAPVRPSWVGLGIVLLGLVTFAYGIWPGQNQFLQGCAMIMALFRRRAAAVRMGCHEGRVVPHPVSRVRHSLAAAGL